MLLSGVHMKIQRNDACPCGSGKKYKKCCLPIESVPSFKRSNKALRNIDFSFEVNPILDDICDDALDKIEMGDIEQVREVIQALFADYPDYYMLHFVMGVCSMKEDNFTESIVHFEKTVAVCPVLPEAYYNLAASYLKAARVASAADAFRKVIELDNKREGLGKSAQEELDQLESLTRETSGCSLDEYIQGEILFDQAFECMILGRYQSAIMLFERVLKINKKHVQSYGNIGMAYLKLSNKAKSIEYLDKALAIDPHYEPAWHNKMAALSLDDDEIRAVPMTKIEYYKDGIV